MATSIVTRQGPKMGTKQIYLPTFTLTLIRTPNLPPTFASFIVPLKTNKLDVRDYLWNVYGVSTLGVRSYIQQQKPMLNAPGKKFKVWARPRSIKKITVEMDRPFVWPVEPRDYEPWDKTTFEAAQKDREESRDLMRPEHRLEAHPEHATIAQQAQALLAGDEPWKPTSSRAAATSRLWQDVGKPIEVEADVSLANLR